MSRQRLMISFLGIIVICLIYVVCEIVRRRPPRIYFLYGAGIIASMIAAVLLRQKWILTIGMVFYGLLRREMQKRMQEDEAKCEDDLDEPER